MSNRRGTLPTGVPPTISAPSHLSTILQSSANDSSASVKSFMSQVPQGYHESNENDYPPTDSYRVEHTRSASPAVGSSTSGKGSVSTTNNLNPKSRPYIPSPLIKQESSFEPQLSREPLGANMEKERFGAVRQPYGPSYGQQDGMRSPTHNQSHSNGAVYQGSTTYPGQYGAPPGHHAVNATYSGYAPEYSQPRYGDRYSDGSAPWGRAYGLAGDVNQSSHRLAVQSPMAPMSMPMISQWDRGTQPGYPVSENYSYGGPVSQQLGSQSRAYKHPHYYSGNDGTSPGYAGGQGQGQYRSGSNNNPYFNAQPNTYQNGQRYQRKGHSGGSSYAERIRKDSTDARIGDAYGGQGHGNAVKHNNFVDQNNRFERHSSGNVDLHQHPGSRPQPRVDLGRRDMRTPRNEDQGGLTRYSSPVSVSEILQNINKLPRPQTTEPDFTSERNNTPQLRSRRGQTINPNNSARRETNFGKYSNNTTRTDLEGLQNITSQTQQTPVKPLTLVHSSSPDPFTTPAKDNMIRNPWNTQLTIVRSPEALRVEQASPQLRRLTGNLTRKPTVEEALDFTNLPFVEYCRSESLGPDIFGVIKIKNIPYGVNRQEIMAFMGRNARLVSESEHEPIHIVMERVTSKTLDCYVEFINLNEAINAINRFETNKNGGRGGRLGSRHVEIELASQEQLMKDLFPKAKNVKWTNGTANVLPTDPNDKYNSGFQGFVSKEELVMLVKHVEAPQRSPFSKDCPQRPFECLISTLLKYPWYMVDYITIEDRNLIHDATKSLMSMLKNHVMHNREDTRLTTSLLKRAYRAVLACPGFTPCMKDDIMVICNVDVDWAIEFGLPHHATEWRCLWAIGPKKGIPQDVLMYYIDLIKNITVQQRQRLSLAEQAAQNRGAVYHNNSMFGDIQSLIKYPPSLANRSLAEVAACEWLAIEDALRRALTPALPAPAAQ